MSGNPGTCTNAGIQNAGLPPIEGMLLTALDCYKGNWNNAAEGYTNNCYPLPQSCGKNFGTAYNASDGTSLQAAFDAIFTDIFKKAAPRYSSATA